MLINIKTSLKPVRFVIFEPCFTVLQFYLLFSLCFALISEVFQGVDIYLCDNNVEIAVEINFRFIGLSVQKSRFYKSYDLSKYVFKVVGTNKNIIN